MLLTNARDNVRFDVSGNYIAQVENINLRSIVIRFNHPNSPPFLFDSIGNKRYGYFKCIFVTHAAFAGNVANFLISTTDPSRADVYI